MDDKKRILAAIVDDDSSLCKALGRLFRAAGIDSLSYSSAEQFLENRQASEPDCLILDIQLPGMSGIELQRTLKASGRNLPVIFITAHDEPETRTLGERAGCLAYLRKTDPGDSVLEAIYGISERKNRGSALALAGPIISPSHHLGALPIN
jgi:FixJ family two-component response regulator